MKRFKCLFAVFLLAIYAHHGFALIILDSSDNTPLVRTPVFNSSGTMLGLTNERGFIRIENSQYPIKIKSLGYEDYISQSKADTIWMLPAVYQLDALTVIPVERPVMRVVSYMREYMSITNEDDTIMSFTEYTADVFIPVKKVKKFKARKQPRILASRTVKRKIDKDGQDSIYKSEYTEDNISWASLLEFPDKPFLIKPLTDGLNTRIDTIAGKYSIAELKKVTPDHASVQTDLLADFKNHSVTPLVFKLLGLTMDIVEMQSNWIFRPTITGEYSVTDIISGTFSFKINCKGKWLKKALDSKKDVTAYGYFEIYPVRSEFLTVEEAKAMIKDDSMTEKLVVSPYAPPLDPSVEAIVEIARTDSSR